MPISSKGSYFQLLQKGTITKITTSTAVQTGILVVYEFEHSEHTVSHPHAIHAYLLHTHTPVCSKFFFFLCKILMVLDFCQLFT